MSSDLQTAVEGASIALDSAGDIVGPIGSGRPRFELFHAANSICSQKVRCVLAYHGLSYASHPVNLFVGQTYLPDYVRLRMMGCDRLGGPLASHHSGDTSASAGGCDGAVVPTLIDWEEHAVLVDSRLICLHLDAQVGPDRCLRPPALASEIDDHLRIIDGLPNYQLLMGRTPGENESGDTRDGIGGSFSMKKVAWCDRALGEHSADEALVRAYTAKRAKELSAAEHLFSDDAMRSAYGRAKSALDGLEEALKRRDGTWLFGDRLTMADLFWAIELLRMKNTGIANHWEEARLPHVEHFFAAVPTIPAIRSAVINWAGASF